MSELKLRRLLEHNQRLREDLARPRIKVSEASARCVILSFQNSLSLTVARNSLIRYCRTTKDFLVPSVWGPVNRGEHPYEQPNKGCCTIQ